MTCTSTSYNNRRNARLRIDAAREDRQERLAEYLTRTTAVRLYREEVAKRKRRRATEAARVMTAARAELERHIELQQKKSGRPKKVKP